MIGKTLAHYEITQLLGKGGMGEVYRAKDTKLGREVALKILPPEVAGDFERSQRFEREARTLAALQHANIASIYGFEDVGGVRFLVMELAEGDDLAERLSRGRLPVDDALRIAKEIAIGLEAAHEKGIVHRDLKPANVKVDAHGRVKILDFGLARAYTDENVGVEDLENSPTISAAATRDGRILGTAAYMAPEQARGQPVDHRADIWAFGVVLHEMLTGQRMFAGNTVSDVLAAVLMREPDWSALPSDVPVAVRRLLQRCLERDSSLRLQHIGEARIALDRLEAGAEEEEAAPAAAGWTGVRIAAIAIAVLASLGAGILIDRYFLSSPSSSVSSGFHGELEIAPPPDTEFISGLAISPDGQRVAFIARGLDGQLGLWVRDLDSPNARLLPGTSDARYPFWAPDSRRIGFFSQSRLRITGLLGGSPSVVANTGSAGEVRGGTWGADDRIVYAPTYTGELYVVEASGGDPAIATEIGVDEGIGTQRFPSFLPDGRRFVFFGSRGTGVEPGHLFLGRLGSTETKQLATANSTAVYAEPGYILYVQGESLVAHRFDSDAEELTGNPIPLGILLPGNVNAASQRSLSVSRNGILVYRLDKQSPNEIVWVDREGHDVTSVVDDLESGRFWPSVSRDGRRLVVSQYPPGASGGSIWVYDLERGLSTPKTFGEGDDTISIWSPDGSEIAYSSARDRDGGIYRIAGDDAGEAKPWITSDNMLFPSAWLADPPRLIYSQVGSTGETSLWISSSEDAEPRRLGPEQVSESNGDVAPGGDWLAFQSDASGQVEVYARRLDDTLGTTRLRISSNGGRNPRWRADGGELFYMNNSGELMSVPIESLDPFRPGKPSALFHANLETAPYRQYDVSPDGQRFLLNRIVITQRTPISVVVGWEERLGSDSTR